MSDQGIATWRGRRLIEMSKEELIRIIHDMGKNTDKQIIQHHKDLEKLK